MKNATSLSFERATSLDSHLKLHIAHSHSTGELPENSSVPLAQSSLDSLTPTNVPSLSPFFTEILNKQQRQLIETSWRHNRSLGTKVLLVVIAADPDIKLVFGLEKVQSRLKYNPIFRRHATLITRSFEYAIKNLGSMEKLEQYFQVS
jgi:hypothetical protein